MNIKNNITKNPIYKEARSYVQELRGCMLIDVATKFTVLQVAQGQQWNAQVQKALSNTIRLYATRELTCLSISLIKV